MRMKPMESEKTDPTRREITTQEASQISGLSLNHLAYLLRQGKLEGRRFGQRMWVIYADSLEQYLSTPHKSGPKGPRKAPLTPTKHSNDISEGKK
jgi:excisionase family DNA binding protein